MCFVEDVVPLGYDGVEYVGSVGFATGVVVVVQDAGETLYSVGVAAFCVIDYGRAVDAAGVFAVVVHVIGHSEASFPRGHVAVAVVYGRLVVVIYGCVVVYVVQLDVSAFGS